MTTKPTYTIVSDIDYSKLDFDPHEKEPLPEAMEQNPVILRIIQLAEAHLKNIYPPETVFIDTDSNVCYDPDNLNTRVQPDVYIALDVDAAAIRQRRLYLPWEAGKPPDFALEVASASTFLNDLGRKRDVYARIGVFEYWLFDPTGGDYYGQPLAGERLVDGQYAPIEITTSPDGVLKGFSSILGQYLCWHDGMAGLYDLETNTYHLDLIQTGEQLAAERSAREDAEATLGAERAAREDAEARIRQLEEELRRRQAGN